MPTGEVSPRTRSREELEHPCLCRQQAAWGRARDPAVLWGPSQRRCPAFLGCCHPPGSPCFRLHRCGPQRFLPAARGMGLSRWRRRPEGTPCLHPPARPRGEAALWGWHSARAALGQAGGLLSCQGPWQAPRLPRASVVLWFPPCCVHLRGPAVPPRPGPPWASPCQGTGGDGDVSALLGAGCPAPAPAMPPPAG